MSAHDQVDETGMPVHLQMGFTAAGEGPEDDAASVWVWCWCPAGPSCSVYPLRPGPAQLYPVYFATVRQLGTDPHELAQEIVHGSR